MLGYELKDLNNMVYGLDNAILLTFSDENPTVYNYLVTARDFLQGLWSEGYFD
jgi:hypothetical protein